MKWQVLHVEDDAQIGSNLKRYFEGETDLIRGQTLEVVSLGRFDQAVDFLESRKIDLLILDVRRGDGLAAENDAGARLMEVVKATRFIPIIFYTGAPELVANVASPLVKVVSKDLGVEEAYGAARELLETNLPGINRALLDHFEEVKRSYLWNFVENHWGKFSSTEANAELAFLLARRLSAAMDETGIGALSEYLGDANVHLPAGDKVHPLRYYFIPPIETRDPGAGDIYLGALHGRNGYWMLLTPGCDLVCSRVTAEFVLLAFCQDLKQHPTFLTWKQRTGRNKDDELTRLIENRKGDRFYFLPKNLIFSDLVIDLQDLVVCPNAWLNGLQRVASLDSPYLEEMQVRFGRYYGRVGSPDVNSASIIVELEQELAQGL